MAHLSACDCSICFFENRTQHLTHVFVFSSAVRQSRKKGHAQHYFAGKVLAVVVSVAIFVDHRLVKPLSLKLFSRHSSTDLAERVGATAEACQPTRDGLQPKSEMASDLRAVASNLLAMASNLVWMASNLVANHCENW